jgi:hypothetical protein
MPKRRSCCFDLASQQHSRAVEEGAVLGDSCWRRWHRWHHRRHGIPIARQAGLPPRNSDLYDCERAHHHYHPGFGSEIISGEQTFRSRRQVDRRSCRFQVYLLGRAAIGSPSANDGTTLLRRYLACSGRFVSLGADVALQKRSHVHIRRQERVVHFKSS